MRTLSIYSQQNWKGKNRLNYRHGSLPKGGKNMLEGWKEQKHYPNFLFFPDLLRYNQQIKLYIFKVNNVMF